MAKDNDEFNFDDLRDSDSDSEEANFDDFNKIDESTDVETPTDEAQGSAEEIPYEVDNDFDAEGIADKKPFYKTQNGIIAIVCGIGIAVWLAFSTLTNVTPNGMSDNQQQVSDMAELAANRPSPNPDGTINPTFDSQATAFNAQSTPALDNSVPSGAVDAPVPREPVIVAPAENVVNQAPANAFDAPTQQASLDTQKKLAEINNQLAIFGTQFGFVVDEIKAIEARQALIEANVKKVYIAASGDDKILKEVKKLTKKVSRLNRKMINLTKKKLTKKKKTPPKRFILEKYSMTGFSNGKAWVKTAVTGATFNVVVGENVIALGKVVSVSSKEILFNKGGVILPAK